LLSSIRLSFYIYYKTVINKLINIFVQIYELKGFLSMVLRYNANYYSKSLPNVSSGKTKTRIMADLRNEVRSRLV